MNPTEHTTNDYAATVYANKLIAANSENDGLFYNLARSLYFEDTPFIVEVCDYLEEHDAYVLDRVDDIFFSIDCQL